MSPVNYIIEITQKYLRWSDQLDENITVTNDYGALR